MSWLQRVQQLYRQGGFTDRSLAARTGISHTHISNILNGRSIPSLEMLYMLLDGLTRNEASRAEILQLFTQENPGYKQHTTQKDKVAMPSKADIVRLTDVVTELNGLLREFLQEQRRNPQ